MKRIKAYFLIIVGLVVGGFLTKDGIQEKAKLERIEASGKTALGVINGGEWNGGRRGKSYELDIEYRPDAKVPALTQTFRVTKEYYNTHTKDGVITNELAIIKYDPADPTIAVVADGHADTTYFRYVGPILGLILIGSGLWSLKKGR